MVRPFAKDLARQFLSHAQARAVHGDPVDDGVRTGHVDVLENARNMTRGVGALAGMHPAIEIGKKCLSWLDVTHKLIAQDIERHAFRGNQVFGALIGLALAVDKRPDAEWIAESEDAIAHDQKDDGVGTAAATVNGGNRPEYMFRRELKLGLHLEFVRKHVQQDLGIGTGIDVPQILTEQLVLELGGIGKVSVMRQRKTEGGIYVKWLGLSDGVLAGSGVPHMPEPQIALEVAHMVRLEDITHQPGVLAQVDALPVAGKNSGRILPTVLQHHQAIIDRLVYGTFGKDADNAAHRKKPSDAWTVRTAASDRTAPVP